MENRALDDDLIMSLVEMALARPEEERRDYLETACADNPGLFSEVWKYVQREQRMGDFLLEPLYPAYSVEHPFAPDDVLDGRFRIEREIAQGGMGVVYAAWDQRLERRVALKCAKTGFRKRLPPEVRHAREISHPNVCKIFDIHQAESATAGEVDFVTMEYLEGETLAERLKDGPVPEPEARAIARQLCSGLAEAHIQSVVHGDLKSNNVILTTAADGSTRAVITDFGMARGTGVAQPTLQSGLRGGTPAYMAPELMKGDKASVASDIYALGVLLHELASGAKPAPGKPLALSPKWNRIVTRCLAADPAERYQGAAEIAAAFNPPRARRWLLIGAAAVLVAAVTGAVTYQRATTPKEIVRLAILPFETDIDSQRLSEGLLLDAGERLSHVKPGRARLTLIPLGDALQNKVDQSAKARTVLGATHALSGTLRQENGRFLSRAYLTDLRTQIRVADWQAAYTSDELRNMPVALAGMVTGTLGLPPLVLAATVSPAAYSDWAKGVSLARALGTRDPGVDRALPFLERAVAADPASPLTHAKLAEAQWSKYRLTNDSQWKERALASLKNAEQRNPDLAAVRFVSGIINDDNGQYEQAQEDFLRAVELEPMNADAWRQLGRVYEDEDQESRALASYLKAIEVQPEYFKNYQYLGAFYFVRGDYEEAVRQYKKMVQLTPDLAAAHYALATPYLNLGRYADAEYELHVAINFQETSNAVQGLGLSRMYQGLDREAIPYFQRALRIGPETSLLYVNLGTSFRRAGFPMESEQAYRRGLELAEARLATNPRDAYERSGLAYLSARLGIRGRAEFETAQAVQLSRGANNVRWMAVLTYEALGLRDRTLSLIQNAPGSLLDRLNRFPDLADLRADSRFQLLLASINVQ